MNEVLELVKDLANGLVVFVALGLGAASVAHITKTAADWAKPVTAVLDKVPAEVKSVGKFVLGAAAVAVAGKMFPVALQ